jgi:hypothetical protein
MHAEEAPSPRVSTAACVVGRAVNELRGRKFNTRLGIREISKWRILDEALRQMRIKCVDSP